MVNTRLAKATTVFRGLSNVHCLGLNTGQKLYAAVVVSTVKHTTYRRAWTRYINRTSDRQSKLHGNKVINAEVFASHGLNRDCSRESKRRSRFAGNINITRMAAERQAYFYALGCTLANSTKRRRPQRLLVVNIS